MDRLIRCIWSTCLYILFHSARIVFTVTGMRIRGALVAIWYQEQILVIRKSYRKGWSIPGGLLKKGETWEQAAVRETYEEVGIRLAAKDLVFIKEVPGDLGPGDRLRLFEVQTPSPPDIQLDHKEIIHAEFVTPATALERDLYQHVRTYLLTREPQLKKEMLP